MVCIVVAMLVDKGLLNYDELVSSYWPAFSQCGKASLTLADVLRHESGLSRFGNHTYQNEDILRENIKNNAVGEVIERCKPEYPGNIDGTSTKRAYHAATRGFILNEIVRRADPGNR